MKSLLLGLVATAALATPRPARDTADVGNRGTYSVGIFNPLRIAFHNRFELQAAPILFFVAPHLDFRFAILKPPVVNGELPMGVRLTAEAGLLMPTFLWPFFPTMEGQIQNHWHSKSPL